MHKFDKIYVGWPQKLRYEFCGAIHENQVHYNYGIIYKSAH